MTGDGARSEVPELAQRSQLVADAYAFACDVHEGPRRRGDTRIDHPMAVAALLHEAGYGDHVLAAALLHDVIEDTATDAAELRARFGDHVAVLVAELTENPAIDDYETRKAALRSQATGDSEEAAAIFAADKLASIRKLLRRGRVPAPHQLDHYERTAARLRTRFPRVPFLDELESGLAALRAGARDGAAED